MDGYSGIHEKFSSLQNPVLLAKVVDNHLRQLTLYDQPASAWKEDVTYLADKPTLIRHTAQTVPEGLEALSEYFVNPVQELIDAQKGPVSTAGAIDEFVLHDNTFAIHKPNIYETLMYAPNDALREHTGSGEDIDTALDALAKQLYKAKLEWDGKQRMMSNPDDYGSTHLNF